MTIEIPVLLLYIIGAIAGVVVLFFSVIYTSALVAVALEPKMVLMKLERGNDLIANEGTSASISVAKEVSNLCAEAIESMK